MSISRLAIIIFFLLYGLHYFFSLSFAPVVIAICALVIAAAMIFGGLFVPVLPSTALNREDRRWFW
jgi:hypothetical protein